MALIVDNSCRDRVFTKSPTKNYVPIRHALFGGKKYRGARCKLAYGGKLRDELFGSGLAKLEIQQLDRAGLAILVDSNQMAQLQESLESSGQLSSNDSHVIAIALLGSVRLLVADDHKLEADFKNKDVLDSPRGKVYKTSNHKSLIRESCAREN